MTGPRMSNKLTIALPRVAWTDACTSRAAVSTELALVLIGLVYGLLILYRWRARPLADWQVLGVRARLLKGASAPVELRFARDEYFLSWAELNRAGAEAALR